MPFCCFEVFLWKFIENFSFNIKVTIAERSTEILCHFFFLTIFEKGQILRKIWICLNNCFWTNQLKRININTNCFSPQSESHTAKLCLSVVLKYFWRNSLRTFLFIHKRVYLRNEHWNTQKVCFSYHVWKR